MTDDPESNLRARRAWLDEHLQTVPVVVIEGVVGPNGISAGKGGGERLWTLRMTLQAWRLADGPLQNASLTLRRQVDDATLKIYRLAACPYVPVRMRARLVMDAGMGGPEALLEEVPRAIDDAELAEQAARLKRPVIHEDGVFGACTLDKRLDWFDAAAEWNGRNIRIHLQVGTLAALPAVLRRAHELWNDAAGWHARILDRTVADLLDLKNDTWLDEDEKPVTAGEFTQRIALQSVGIDGNGAFEFCFTDGDLFWGHAIMVRGTLEEGPTAANIAG